MAPSRPAAKQSVSSREQRLDDALVDSAVPPPFQLAGAQCRPPRCLDVVPWLPHCPSGPHRFPPLLRQHRGQHGATHASHAAQLWWLPRAHPRVRGRWPKVGAAGLSRRRGVDPGEVDPALSPDWLAPGGGCPLRPAPFSICFGLICLFSRLADLFANWVFGGYLFVCEGFASRWVGEIQIGGISTGPPARFRGRRRWLVVHPAIPP